MPARNIKSWLWLAAALIAADQISKWIVLGALRPGDSRYVAPFFNWVLTFNSGAAFSFLSDAGGWQRWFFTILALIVSAFMLGCALGGLWSSRRFGRNLVLALDAALAACCLALPPLLEFLHHHQHSPPPGVGMDRHRAAGAGHREVPP